jgi:hypothetical protein
MLQNKPSSPIHCSLVYKRDNSNCWLTENDLKEGADAQRTNLLLFSHSLAELPASVIGHAQLSVVRGALSRMTECGSAPCHEQRARRTTWRGKLTLVWVQFKLFEDRDKVGLSNLYVQYV